MSQQSLFDGGASADLRSVHAGPRQTISRVRHPRRGDGLAVRDNGPSFFEMPDGRRIDMPIHGGGASTTRSWLVLDDPEHGRIEADQIGSRGESHQRKTSLAFGSGWLVWESLENDAHWFRFEPDDGRVFRFEWKSIARGTPDYVRRFDRARKNVPEITDEERKWMTITARTGEVYSFRDEDSTAQTPPTNH